MYAAYQSGQFSSASPDALLVLTVGGRGAPNALARSLADANAVSWQSIRPGSRVVISCSSQPLPSGSLNVAKEL
jgi:hypothetical protein